MLEEHFILESATLAYLLICLANQRSMSRIFPPNVLDDVVNRLFVILFV